MRSQSILREELIPFIWFTCDGGETNVLPAASDESQSPALLAAARAPREAMQPQRHRMLR